MKKALYNQIGNGYNLTRSADPYIAERLYEAVFSGTDGSYLDIGCGTGNYAIALSEKGLSISGIDPSDKMLASAKERCTNIRWHNGSAENLHFADKTFTGIVGMLTLHHWQDIPAGFKEMHRVIQPGGKVAFFTSEPEQMKGYWLNHYFPGMLQQSIRQMPSVESLGDAASDAGFKVLPTEKYSIKADLKDHFLYVGKDRPEIYLDKVIRDGISSFAALANAEEVERGLFQLESDINSGKFNQVKALYQNDIGDYMIFKAVRTK